MKRPKPEVTVLVTHHLNENDKYLDACLKSLLFTDNIPIEIICISDAKNPPRVEIAARDPRVQLIWDGKHVTCADKWREALRIADPKAPYFIAISDDVMVSYGMIGKMQWMLAHSGIGEAILCPQSNSDQTTRYLWNSGFPVKCKLEDLDAGKYGGRMRDDVIHWGGKENLLIPQDWVSFYCVMMPKSVIAKVGELDARMEVRGNDLDYCRRARQLGIPSYVQIGAFCLHFGDQTIPKCTTTTQYQAADEAMKEKYASHR